MLHNIQANGSKKDAAYCVIKHLLDSGEITSGRIYSEQMLAEEVGKSLRTPISRTPVREALQAIAREGLVTIVPKKGMLVTSTLTLQEVADMFGLRAAIETFALRKALPVLNDNDIAVFRAFIEEQEEHVRRDSPEGFVRCDFRMHMHILEVYRNEWMKDIIRNLSERFFSVGLRAVLSSGRSCRDLLAEHVEYVDALEERDFTKAHTCLLRHFDRGIEMFQQRPSPGGSPDAGGGREFTPEKVF